MNTLETDFSMCRVLSHGTLCDKKPEEHQNL